ncbi:DUF3616 domain-containing protein [Hymenobacter sp. 15J16-1T3B]|uniref:DUF3616 domain-containing protein n=1 Tax=Hymenobacter sp. 15J16-1T3B TaxID=2886941 RepID=UPI001D0F9691|nr:DUF3616 domain-containing protein [Hymenobacter sp. 15J16-1T3B]MCC3156615.1 DUF3616 domain-containing protein [Hymenobacter sp. 15J16-1T3B]
MPRIRTCALHFAPERSRNAAGKHVRDGLSSVLLTGDNLWLAGDESATLERLRRQPDGSFGQHASFRLADLLDLPGSQEQEVDLEGLAEAGHYLWLIGSHSRKRQKPDPEHLDAPKQLGKLAEVEADANRYLLARVPLLPDPVTGNFTLRRTAPDPDRPDRLLFAAALRPRGGANELLHLLRRDEHLGPFLQLPGKDNGFDIEGLAAAPDGRVFVGLRGPVLRGWAVVLELLPRPDKHGQLRLAKLPGTANRYHKHFLDLGGMGLRELRLLDRDLYLLAGPTMDLDGTIAVYCWPDMLGPHARHTLHHPERLQRLFDVPHRAGHDRAEGMAVLDEQHVLCVFDTPADARKPAADAVLADIYTLPKRARPKRAK